MRDRLFGNLVVWGAEGLMKGWVKEQGAAELTGKCRDEGDEQGGEGMERMRHRGASRESSCSVSE